MYIKRGTFYQRSILEETDDELYQQHVLSRGGVNSKEVGQKRSQRLIDIELSMETHSQEERKVIFDEFRKLLAPLSLICSFMA